MSYFTGGQTDGWTDSCNIMCTPAVRSILFKLLAHALHAPMRVNVIENNTEKHISNIETGMVRATHQERGQAIGTLQADNLPKQVGDILYE